MEHKMEIIRNYREVLDKVGKCTSAYLYMVEIETGTIWFFSDVDKKYDIDKVTTVEKLMDIVHPLDQKMLSDDLTEVFSGKKNYHDLSYRWINSNNEIIWINCRGTVVNDDKGKPFLFIGRVSEDAMRHLYDVKTGLFNKTKLKTDMTDYLNQDNRYLILMDVDNLSAINLRYGLEYGDELLKKIAITIENSNGVIGAYHIDNNDFALIVNASCDDEAYKIYLSICEELKEFCAFAGSITPVNKEMFIEPLQVLNAGMMSLAKAKTKRSSVQFFSSSDAKEKLEDVILCDHMLNSIHNEFNGFELYYQPQIKSNTYAIYGFEALLRYNLPSGERIFPDRFIPLLEQTGLIKTVGMWVLKSALKQLVQWRKAIADLHMSVNLSTVQFEDNKLADKIIEVLKSFDLAGDCLTLELTESMKLSYTEEFHNTILKLKNYGIHISIDDFGKGYSNISYIEQYGVDEIKIDRFFISSINENAYNYNIVKGIVDLARNNNISLCCEGVESIKELNTLECLNP
ncbi:MAG: EAL domain-containing protein, partial [Erysipelotrichaceae bacterium]